MATPITEASSKSATEAAESNETVIQDAVVVNENNLTATEVPEEAKTMPLEDDQQDDSDEKERQAIEALDSFSDPQRWVIGKPPELGGTEDTYSVYIQKKLGYMPRIKFFALVTNTIGEAIKAGGTVNFGGMDAFDLDAGSMKERAAKLTSQDFADAGSFMALAMQLMAYSETFLIDCYIMWLDVPAKERRWERNILSQGWNPDHGEYGLKEEDGLKMIETFIDQNYEDIRRFFVEEIPKLGARIQQREIERQGRESASGQSKQ